VKSLDLDVQPWRLKHRATISALAIGRSAGGDLSLEGDSFMERKPTTGKPVGAKPPNPMEASAAPLADKLGTLEQEVKDTVQGATAAVAHTVETVKGAMQETATSLHHTFDLWRQVRRHPWLVLGGAMFAGYVVSTLIRRLPPPWMPQR
jgi:plasmid maintenance system antidote protein VapI